MAESSGASGPEIFGPYVIHEQLGQGGMAVVHRAVKGGIGGFERVVALKRILTSLAADPTFVDSFVREATLASKLHHANIVQIYDLGVVGDSYYIAMEYIRGRDLRQLLRQARYAAGIAPVLITLSMLFELCDALDYAHRLTDNLGQPLGLIHRRRVAGQPARGSRRPSQDHRLRHRKSEPRKPMLARSRPIPSARPWSRTSGRPGPRKRRRRSRARPLLHYSASPRPQTRSPSTPLATAPKRRRKPMVTTTTVATARRRSRLSQGRR